MPEILTKHPQIVIDLLLKTGRVKRSTNKQILRDCPTGRPR